MSSRLIRTTRASAPLLFVLSGCAASILGQVPGRYDGRWWLGADLNERYGFVTGFVDCYTFEFKGPARFEGKSWMAYRDSITAFYRGDSSRLSQSVPDVLNRFDDRGKASPGAGEEYPGPHGYFDGLYWQQIGDFETEKDRLGFVEGFLLCHSTLTHDKGGTFSKTPTEYTALISGWYRIDPQSGAADTGRVNAKIADVLFKFRDRVR